MIEINGIVIHVWWVCGGIFLFFVLCLYMFFDILLQQVTTDRSNE